MVSGRAVRGHGLLAPRPRPMLRLPDRAGLLPARPASRTTAGSVDPLYPEPAGDRGWIAEEPLPWLGPRTRTGSNQSLTDLVDDGSVPAKAAELLRDLVRGRSSVLVIAGRAGAGKSTLLEALLPLYPRRDRRIRLRGAFETFAWESDARFDPAEAVLVAEEISGHLPTYLWGPPVGRFLGWRHRGAALIATAHGESVEDVASLIAGYPLRLPLRAVAAFDVIVRLGPAPDRTPGRSSVTDIWSTHLTPEGGLGHASVFHSCGRERATDAPGRHAPGESPAGPAAPG